MSMLTDVLTDLARHAGEAAPPADVADDPRLAGSMTGGCPWSHLLGAATALAPVDAEGSRVATSAAVGVVVHRLARLWVLVGDLHLAASREPAADTSTVARTRELVAELFELTDLLLVGAPSDRADAGTEVVEHG